MEENVTRARAYSQKLSRFLQNTFLVEHKEGPCIKLVLAHLVPRDKGHVNVYQFGSAPIEEELLTNLQHQIEMDAFNDAEGIGGQQKYQLLAFFRDIPEEHLSRLTFREGDEGNVEKDFDSEPASKEGIIAQQMRHNEAIMRTSVGAMHNVQTALLSQNSKLMVQIEKAEEMRVKMFEMMEALHSNQAEREFIRRQQEFDQNTKHEMFEKVTGLLPNAVNRIIGKNLLPEKKTPQQEMLKNFVRSMTDDQMMGLMTTMQGLGFSSEQMLNLNDVVKELSMEIAKEKAEKAVKDGPNGVS